MSDFMGMDGIGTVWPAPNGGSVLGTGARPAAVRSEYGIQFHDNSAVVMVYDNEGSALRTLTHQRKDLARMGVPEEYWPVLVQRTVETIVTTWRPLND